MNMKSLVSSLFLTLLLLSGCAPKVYKDVFQEDKGFYKKTFNVPADTLLTAAEDVILSEGFSIQKKDKENRAIVSTKIFSEGKETIKLVLSATVAQKDDSAILYMTANQLREKLHTSTEIDWLLFMPRPKDKKATNVNVSGVTVDDPKFYQRFFKKVEENIKR